MSRIWRYVLATDNGMAPCVENKWLSLCCCKPRIRESARVGDWVVGFVPKRIKLAHVAWLGRVGKIFPLGEYEQQFSSRLDAIYSLRRSASGEEVLVPLRTDYHADEHSRARDLKGRNCLIFEPFWYWGNAGVPVPHEIADLAHYHVGQSTRKSSPEKIASLEAWAKSVAPPGVHGEPRDRTAQGDQLRAANNPLQRPRFRTSGGFRQC